MLLRVTTVLLLLGTGNSGSQLAGGILKSNHKFKGIHLTTIIFAVAANLPHKVSGRSYPYENHQDNTEHYDEPNDKNGTDVKLRMLIPMNNIFPEFVKVDRDPKGNGMTATGFSVDLFIEVMDSLPNRVSYEFFPYESTDSLEMGYYDQLILQLHLEVSSFSFFLFFNLLIFLNSLHWPVSLLAFILMENYECTAEIRWSRRGYNNHVRQIKVRRLHTAIHDSRCFHDCSNCGRPRIKSLVVSEAIYLGFMATYNSSVLVKRASGLVF